MGMWSRGITFGVLAALVLAWGVDQWRLGVGRSRMRTALDDPARRVQILEPELREVRMLERLAGAAERELVPPDDRRATALLEEAIRTQPTRGALWLKLARLRLFAGKRAEAVAALGMSDFLEPNLPNQRLEAIALWVLLGERDRAGDLAARAARLDARLLEDCARQLRLGGFTSMEVFERLGGPSLEKGALQRLLTTLGGSANEELVAGLGPERLADPDIRRQAGQLLAAPLRSRPLLDLWRQEVGSDLTPTTPGGLVLAHNLDLRQGPPPPDARFVLGWQPFPASVHMTAMAASADEDTTVGPLAIRIQYDAFSGLDDRERRWDFYRVIVPENEAWGLPVSVRLDPPESSRVTIMASWEGGEARVSPPRPLEGNWQRLEITVEPAAKERLVTLSVLRQPRTSSAIATGRVWIAPMADHLLPTSLQTISDSAGKNLSTTAR